LALGILAVGVVACGGGDSNNSDGNSSNGGSSGGATTVEMKEFEFVPNSLEATAGQKLTLTLKNVGSVEHDIHWDDLGGSVVDKKVDPGKSETLEITAPSQAGTYDFYCTIPGHKEAGMTGKLTVK